jgi:hypothetical protein
LFIDYKKAYNNLNLDKIWKMLTEDKTLPHLTEAIRSLYKNTEICIKYVNEQISEPITISQSVRQESGLAPNLFSIYGNELPPGVSYLEVVAGLVCTYDPKSYAGTNFATGRVSLARQVKG